MGSSLSKKPRGQPDRPLPSGVEEPTADEEGEGQVPVEGRPDTQEGLTFGLVQLNDPVVQEASEGEAVSVTDAGDKLQVRTPNGRIGNVPPTYVSEVRDRSLTSGTIQKIQKRPPQVVVHLSG